MLKLRTIVLCSLGVLALVAGSATAADAESTEYVVEGTPVAGETALKAKTETGTTNKFKGTPFGVSTQIECSKRESSGSINSGGTGTSHIVFSTCTVVKPLNCTVKNPEIEAKTQEEFNPAFESDFKPKTGTTFTEITMEGASCSLKGSPFKVEGTQKCENDEMAELEDNTHELVCSSSGSSLTAGGKAATFESSAATLELGSEKKWSVKGADLEATPNPLTWIITTGAEQQITLSAVGTAGDELQIISNGVEPITTTKGPEGWVALVGATCQNKVLVVGGATCTETFKLLKFPPSSQTYEAQYLVKWLSKKPALAQLKVSTVKLRAVN